MAKEVHELFRYTNRNEPYEAAQKQEAVGC